MTGEEFIGRVRKLGRATGVNVTFDPRRGKGSHGLLTYGDRFTTVKNRRKELGKGLVKAMLRQLGIPQKEF